MSDRSTEADKGMIDVTQVSLRQLDDIDDAERERAFRQAFDQTARNSDATSSDSQQAEFEDHPL